MPEEVPVSKLSHLRNGKGQAHPIGFLDLKCDMVKIGGTGKSFLLGCLYRVGLEGEYPANLSAASPLLGALAASIATLPRFRLPKRLGTPRGCPPAVGSTSATPIV